MELIIAGVGVGETEERFRVGFSVAGFTFVVLVLIINTAKSPKSISAQITTNFPTFAILA
ncbi:MAG: hypothetical protein A3H79_02235 [Candidatus Levybacteria bacterium RIFCSPLOWO2_02_FULL_36_8b]|nr:MAG: hypothetical protein A3H79_02235 [Candidatus Levybacteria bacterium RIFCSPLOWO2_02_FULL_36_8b]